MVLVVNFFRILETNILYFVVDIFELAHNVEANFHIP